jgi:aspartyl-tRNA(Asn)/glutamyl-tRNA(Gln) amidotransferase subunit C
MKVTEKDVSYVADLANLELSAEERTGMVRDLNSILDYIDRLNELDTSNVEPMAQISNHFVGDAANADGEGFVHASREDVLYGLRESLSQEAALANAPDGDGTFFRVPKVIEK